MLPCHKSVGNLSPTGAGIYGVRDEAADMAWVEVAPAASATAERIRGRLRHATEGSWWVDACIHNSEVFDLAEPLSRLVNVQI